MKKYFLVIAFLTFVFLLQAATVDTVSIYSNAMHKSSKAVIVKPSTYDNEKLFPVVYLLHGYAGNFSNWIKLVPQIKQYADAFQLLIVCPDGAYSSWYLDSPIDSTYQYETYIGTEVPNYIDAHYKTIADRKARAITGLSMGGHGALFLAFRHQDIYSACGSMSGGVDLNSSRAKYDIVKRIGDTITHADNWKNYSVIHVIEQYLKDSLAIIFDCGTEDDFYPSNIALHEKMLQLKIKHDFISRPGKHDWNYWRNAVVYQLLFFRKYFDTSILN